VAVPLFEFGCFGFADYDAAGCVDGECDCEFADGPDGDFLDGAVGDDVLSVGAEEVVGVELFHDGVEWVVEDLSSSVEEECACDFVFEVEAGYLADFDGDEFVAHGYEEV